MKKLIVASVVALLTAPAAWGQGYLPRPVTNPFDRPPLFGYRGQPFVGKMRHLMSGFGPLDFVLRAGHFGAAVLNAGLRASQVVHHFRNLQRRQQLPLAYLLSTHHVELFHRRVDLGRDGRLGNGKNCALSVHHPGNIRLPRLLGLYADCGALFLIITLLASGPKQAQRCAQDRDRRDIRICGSEISIACE